MSNVTAKQIRTQIADLDRVIKTLTKDRDALQAQLKPRSTKAKATSMPKATRVAKGKLTTTQKIVKLSAQGLRNTDIAQELDIRPQMVSNTLRRIHAGNIADAIGA